MEQFNQTFLSLPWQDYWLWAAYVLSVILLAKSRFWLMPPTVLILAFAFLSKSEIPHTDVQMDMVVSVSGLLILLSIPWVLLFRSSGEED